jgi:hypothetical protein
MDIQPPIQAHLTKDPRSPLVYLCPFPGCRFIHADYNVVDGHERSIHYRYADENRLMARRAVQRINDAPPPVKRDERLTFSPPQRQKHSYGRQVA